MARRKCQSLWILLVVAIFTSFQTTFSSGMPSSQELPQETTQETAQEMLHESPCELQRKCPFNPILYHNYQQCIVCTGQYLTSFPQGVHHDGLASAVELRKNSLTEISTFDFADFSRLCYLDLSINEITTLQDGWAQDLSMLQYLYLGDNKLRSVRNTMFIGLDTLQYLHLDGNLITRLTSHAFGRLPQLQVVHLQHNQLEVIEGNAFVGLEQLRKLNLGFNLLQTLPAHSFCGLDFLNELILSGNIFSLIPVSGFSSLAVLQHMRLDGNRIAALQANSFRNLTALIELTLSWNNITTIEDGWCSGLGVLQYVNISHNHVQTLPLSILESCPNVVILDLGNNQLKDIPVDFFNALQNNHAVDLRDNCLETLPEPDMANSSLVIDIRLEGNPLRCDCHLSWLRDWFQTGRISRLMLRPDELFLRGHYDKLNKASNPLDAKCATPADLSGMLPLNIPPNNFTCYLTTPETKSIYTSSSIGTTKGYIAMSTNSINTVVSEASPAIILDAFDIKMGIIVILAVLSLTLMVAFAVVNCPRLACRWKEQIYFYISDPPLPPRKENSLRKKTAPRQSLIPSDIDSSTSVMLLDMRPVANDNNIRMDVDRLSTDPEDACTGSCKNQVQPNCNFCNGQSTISSAEGRHWSVVVHSSPQEFFPCLPSCDLHGPAMNCCQSTELDRYHAHLRREASSSLARGVILEHIRQCCTFHKSIFNTSHTALLEQPSRSLQNLANPEGLKNRASEESDSPESDVCQMYTMKQQRSSPHFLSNTSMTKDTPLKCENRNDSPDRSSHTVPVSSSLGNLPVSYDGLQDDLLPSKMKAYHHHRSRSARESRRIRKDISSGFRSQRQSSYHASRSSILQCGTSIDNCQSYKKAETKAAMIRRPPAPLPRPEGTLTPRAIHELDGIHFTSQSLIKNEERNKSEEHPQTKRIEDLKCTQKDTTTACIPQPKDLQNLIEHVDGADESLYFIPI